MLTTKKIVYFAEFSAFLKAFSPILIDKSNVLCHNYFYIIFYLKFTKLKKGIVRHIIGLQKRTMIRKHIIAHGRVQGVGLRFTVTGFAKKYNVTGWVRNLYDGTVEMEVQGLEHRVDLFLQELSSDRPGGNGFIRIDRLDISDIPSVNAAKETRFRARY